MATNYTRASLCRCEADLICTAELISPAVMAMLIREGSGIVCLCIKPDKAHNSTCGRWSR